MFRERTFLALPSRKRRCNVIVPVQVNRKAKTVHHAATASLAQIGGHGVGRITDDGNSTLGPPLQADYLVERLKSRKILLSIEGPGHNVLKFKPPMVFNQSDAQHLLVELQQVLRESPMQQNLKA